MFRAEKNIVFQFARQIISGDVLAQANVAVIVCDDSHMPVAAFQPYAGNSLTQRTTAAQLEASEALKGRLWRQIRGKPRI